MLLLLVFFLLPLLNTKENRRLSCQGTAYDIEEEKQKRGQKLEPLVVLSALLLFIRGMGRMSVCMGMSM